LIDLDSVFSFLPANDTEALEQTFIQLVSGGTSEDCLTVNVFAPASAKAGDKLPVVAWIYGGGFEFGGSSTYDGSLVISRSIELGKPIIFVSMNYRVSGWGFLASQEVKDAGVGNLGLQDQRLAFKWIQKYVSNFGGDPTKVTIWGESAGAISVSLQMLTNGGNTEGLFRGGFMQSGSPTPVGDITHGQPGYDMLVSETGCTGLSDTLACLRNVSAATLQAAIDKSPSIFSSTTLNLAWQPRTDGVFLKDTPQNLVLQGSVADIPFVNGDNDDEGTLFALPLLNITTGAEAIAYFKQNYLPEANDTVIQQVSTAYPDNILDGSPFDTGIFNAITPEFKRLAAFQGDIAFQAPRRFFIGERASKQPIFSFLNKRLKAVPLLGTFHASDLLQTFGAGELQDYLIHFVNDLNPNTGSDLPNWPQYSTSSKQLLTLLDGLIPIITSTDNFREDAINLLTQLSQEFPL